MPVEAAPGSCPAHGGQPGGQQAWEGCAAAASFFGTEGAAGVQRGLGGVCSRVHSGSSQRWVAWARVALLAAEQLPSVCAPFPPVATAACCSCTSILRSPTGTTSFTKSLPHDSRRVGPWAQDAVAAWFRPWPARARSCVVWCQACFVSHCQRWRVGANSMHNARAVALCPPPRSGRSSSTCGACRSIAPPGASWQRTVTGSTCRWAPARQAPCLVSALSLVGRARIAQVSPRARIAQAGSEPGPPGVP